jgi:C4-dicarboxylate-specific signal transduction histidine kinase
MRPARPDTRAEVARLEVERRLARGAAHTVNNALTAILGEASLLEEEHKHSPDVAEACNAIRQEIERCGRIWRSVFAPRPSANHAAGRLDTVRLVADLGILLQRSLGRRVEVEARVPDEAPIARADAGHVETLLLALVYHAVDLHPGSLRLRLEAIALDDGAAVALIVESPDSPPERAATALLDPATAANDAIRTALEALPALVREAGARLASTAEAGAARVELRLPSADR